MPVVIDDRLLLDVLAGCLPAAVADEFAGSGVFTTSFWYYRLGRAVFSGSGQGVLSGRLRSHDQTTIDRVRTGLVRLPPGVGLLHPRIVVPTMFNLRCSAAAELARGRGTGRGAHRVGLRCGYHRHSADKVCRHRTRYRLPAVGLTGRSAGHWRDTTSGQQGDLKVSSVTSNSALSWDSVQTPSSGFRSKRTRK
jgi:hypothetical protein